jgi:hypothetical protein
MIAHRLRPLGWIAAVTIAALFFYLISSRVAAERGRLEATNMRIVQVSRDIRRLQTELAARGSMRQLERWNGETLALSAPTADQYRNPMQLASLQLGPVTAKPEAVETALVSAAPTVKDAMPVVERAVETRKGLDTGPVDPSGARRSLLHTVAAVREARASATPAAPLARLQRVAMLDSGTLGDITKRAAREAHEVGGR